MQFLRSVTIFIQTIMRGVIGELFLKSYLSSALEEKDTVSENESGGSEDPSDRHPHDRHAQSPPGPPYPHHSGIRGRNINFSYPCHCL